MYNQPCVVYNSMLQNTLVIIFGGLWLVNIFEFKATCIDLYPKISKKKILNTGIFYLGNSRLAVFILCSLWASKCSKPLPNALFNFPVYHPPGQPPGFHSKVCPDPRAFPATWPDPPGFHFWIAPDPRAIHSLQKCWFLSLLLKSKKQR